MKKPCQRAKRVRFVPPEHNFLRDLHEAASKERSARESVFFDAPYDLLGVPIRIMRLRDFHALLWVRSPFVCGGEIEEAHVAQFLWPLCHAYPDESARQAFLERCALFDFTAAKHDIGEYLDLIFLDSPSAGNSGTPVVSFVAAVVDKLASQYGWTREVILDETLPRILQYCRAINRRLGSKEHQPNRIYQTAAAKYAEEINKVPEKHRARWHEWQWNEMQGGAQ